MINGGCYAFVPTLGYFTGAQKACRDLGAYIVNIDSQEEQDAIYAKAKEWTKGNVFLYRPLSSGRNFKMTYGEPFLIKMFPIASVGLFISGNMQTATISS